MLKNLLVIGIACLCTQLAFAQTFNEQCLTAHNAYRKSHRSSNLELDNTLTKVAREWAKYLATNDIFEHRPNNTYGENLYAKFGGRVPNCAEAVKAWYDEIKDYNFNSPEFSSQTGHFTQVVWKNSAKLGCALGRKGTNYYVVCNYDPPGNYLGQFPANVLKNSS